jgi:serine/threonine-protein kinase
VFPVPLSVRIISDAAAGLGYAHRLTDAQGNRIGLVHRDVSPHNILITFDGSVKLIDFGVAKAAGRLSSTQAGTLKGKYGYMAPEQVVGGDLDGRADLFAVGIVLAEMLMGRRLFTAPNDLDVLLMVRDARLERLDRYGTDIPPTLRSLNSKSSTTANSGFTTGTKMSCASRSIGLSSNASPPRFQQLTISCPW